MEQNMTRIEVISSESILSFKDPRLLWSENWIALTFEIICGAVLLQVFRHAKQTGPHLVYLMLAAASSTFAFEILPAIPCSGYQLWWYHQGMVNVIKQRVPSFVITYFTLVHYMAHCLTSKSNIPSFTRSLVTAITATLIIFPALYLAPQLLVTFFHFDEPVFEDRIAGVPYIQVLVILLLFFHTSHLFHQNYQAIEPQDRNTYSYIRCSLQTGLVSAFYTIVEQYLLYLLLHLTVYLNTGACIVGAVLILAHIAKNELKEKQMTSYSIQGITSPLMRKEWWFVVAALIFTSSVPLWLNTQNLKSSSDRLELGPCNVTHQVMNTSPQEFLRLRYVCPDDTTRFEFDFHCVSTKEIMEGVKKNAKHYTVCGKPFENLLTYKQLFAYSASCLTLFYVIMLFSFTFKVKEEEVENCYKKSD